MVCRRVSEEREQVVPTFMAMGPERSKPLHNFTLPRLKWGNQRYMRCMKVSSNSSSDRRSPARSHSSSQRKDSDGERRRLARDSVKVRRNCVVAVDGDFGIGAVREKLMFDLRAETDKMKDELLREEVEMESMVAAAMASSAVAAEEAESIVAAEEARPWNLRTRRAACKAPIAGAGDGGGGRVNCSPLRTEAAAGATAPANESKLLRVLRGSSGGGGGGFAAAEKKEERAKFAVALKRKEIEEDFMEMVGHRPPRRFKKRPKMVQKQLDLLFPGLWLTEITADTYKVEEIPEANNKR